MTTHNRCSSLWSPRLLSRPLLLGTLILPVLLTARAAPALAAEAPAPGSTVEVFVRKAGSPPAWRFVDKEAPKRFELGKQALVNVKHGDVQYDAKLDVRGIGVAALIDQYLGQSKAPPSVDLAILHFANGMAVPLPFKDAQVMKRLDPFIAVGIVEGANTAALPPIGRKVENYVDVKPVAFTGNKLCVNSRFHPEIGEEHSAIFSPWTFVDTLLAIELVRGEAYYRQFAVSEDADVAAGLKVFRQACQSCHGARKLGGAFGWDFVEPEPIVARVKVGRLLFHVLYRATSEVLRGAQMPAIGFVNEDDARKLYVWLKAIADKPLQPYAP